MLAKTIASWVLFLLAAAPLPVPAAAPGFRLLESATVSSDEVLLSEFLPPGITESFRRAAERVLLGPAPALGAVRQFSRDEIIMACHSAAIPCSSLFELPETVTVRRIGRFLTSADLLPLISKEFGNQSTLAANDISLPGSIQLTGNVPRFHVVSAKKDVLLKSTTIRLAAQAGSSVVPFDVQVRPQFIHPRTASTVATVATGAATEAEIDLVDPRRPASLSITSLQSQLLLRVRPLERGVIGQTVRVRISGGSKTFRATVVAQDSLAAHF